METQKGYNELKDMIWHIIEVWSLQKGMITDILI